MLNSEKDQQSQSTDAFYEYYAEASQSSATIDRFRSIKEVVENELARLPDRAAPLDIIDVGCGAGTQSFLWSAEGHRVFGIDINEPLIELARERAKTLPGFTQFQIGDASSLSFDNASMDVCLVPELLEHVPGWQACIAEFARVLKPGGVLYLSTNNNLCPVQQEFDLPLYSWYPPFLKRRYEKLAVTTRPELVNHATYPAVNWFNYYGLRKHLAGFGFTALDRFDALDRSKLGLPGRIAISLVRTIPPLRFLGHVLTPYTALVATKSVDSVSG